MGVSGRISSSIRLVKGSRNTGTNVLVPSQPTPEEVINVFEALHRTMANGFALSPAATPPTITTADYNDYLATLPIFSNFNSWRRDVPDILGGYGSSYAMNSRSHPLRGHKELVAMLTGLGFISGTKSGGSTHYSVTAEGDRFYRIMQLLTTGEPVDVAAIHNAGVPLQNSELGGRFNSHRWKMKFGKQTALVVQTADAPSVIEKMAVVAAGDTDSFQLLKFATTDGKAAAQLLTSHIRRYAAADVALDLSFQHGGSIYFAGNDGTSNLFADVYLADAKHFYSNYGDDIQFRLLSADLDILATEAADIDKSSSWHLPGYYEYRSNGRAEVPVAVFREGNLIGTFGAWATTAATSAASVTYGDKPLQMLEQSIMNLRAIGILPTP